MEGELSTIPASVDMCGLVTESRKAEDARAEAAKSFITEEDSLEAEIMKEQEKLSLQKETMINKTSVHSFVIGIAEELGSSSSKQLQEESDDQYALSSVASWFSSSVKEATQAIDIPSSIIHQNQNQNQQVGDEDLVQENDDENDDDDDDDSLANGSLASLISSIGYMSTGSRTSTSKRSVNSHPEAHLLQMPENLLDDISTGSVEMIFTDDASITPSLSGMGASSLLIVPPIHNTNHGNHGSLKDLLQDDSSDGADSVAESPTEKTEKDAKDDTNADEQIVNDSQEPSPQNILPSSSELESTTSLQTPQQPETTAIPADSNNCPLSAAMNTVPPPTTTEPLVFENNSKGQDGWGSDSEKDYDIESGARRPVAPKPTTTKLDTSTDTEATMQQSYRSTSSMEPTKDTKLDSSSETETTTIQQSSYEEDEDDVAVGEAKKSSRSMCENHGSKIFICCSILFIAMVCLILSVVTNDETSNAALAIEDISLSPTSSFVPSTSPSSSMFPSFVPSDMPSMVPSDMPSITPSDMPTPLPSQSPSDMPSYEELETIFYAIGDVPYNNVEKVELRDRMRNLPTNGEFLIHVGDMRAGQFPDAPCRREEFMEVRDILLESKIPVFIIPGDNEWTDCPNLSEGQSFWLEAFQDFDKNWDHPFTVHRDPARPENFHFVHKRTIYFGLNIVGGEILDRASNSVLLAEQFEWVKEMLEQHVVENDTLSVVIFGHAFPRMVHQSFFAPLKRYIRDVLKDDIPIMYLNGDYHFYEFEQRYMGLDNMQRLQVDFGTTIPPLKVAVSVSANPTWEQTFSHDRMI